MRRKSFVRLVVIVATISLPIIAGADETEEVELEVTGMT